MGPRSSSAGQRGRNGRATVHATHGPGTIRNRPTTAAGTDSFERLAGGSKKGVYRLTLDDASSVVLYAGNAAENYWTDNSTDPRDPFAEASGLDLLEAATSALTAGRCRAPALLLVDRSQSAYPADVAIVEDLRGGTLEAMISGDAGARPDAAALGRRDAQRHGQGYQARDSARSPPPRPQCAARPAGRTDRARSGLAHLAMSREGPGTGPGPAGPPTGLLRELHARVRPRDWYSLIHGELGADHVMLDSDGRPVIIDIEGVMFFDAEWEHEFTRMRFGRSYKALGIHVQLDPARMALYELARSLSLVEVPLRDSSKPIFPPGFHARHRDLDTGKVLRLSGSPL